jgi:hypothetical protein
VTNPRHRPRVGTPLKLALGFTLCLILLGLTLYAVVGDSGRPSESLDRSLPSTYSNGCHLTVEKNEPLPCLYTYNAEFPTIFLVGDSHAAQWVPAIESMDDSYMINFRFLTKSGCPFVLLKLNSDCSQWVSNVLQEIIKNKPTLVILSNLTNGKYLNFYEDRAYSNLWMSNIEPLLQEFSKLTKILIIEDTPYSSFDTSNCLLSHSQGDCGFRFEESYLTSRIRSYAFKNEFLYLSFNDRLCFNSVCKSGDQKINYYRDENHLSVSLSKRFGPELNNYLHGVIYQ